MGWLNKAVDLKRHSPFQIICASQPMAAAEPSIFGTAPAHLQGGIQANGCSKAGHHWSTIAQHLGYHPDDPRGACLLGLCYLQWHHSSQQHSEAVQAGETDTVLSGARQTLGGGAWEGLGATWCASGCLRVQHEAAPITCSRQLRRTFGRTRDCVLRMPDVVCTASLQSGGETSNLAVTK